MKAKFRLSGLIGILINVLLIPISILLFSLFIFTQFGSFSELDLFVKLLFIIVLISLFIRVVFLVGQIKFQLNTFELHNNQLIYSRLIGAGKKKVISLEDLDGINISTFKYKNRNVEVIHVYHETSRIIEISSELYSNYKDIFYFLKKHDMQIGSEDPDTFLVKLKMSLGKKVKYHYQKL